MNAIINNAVALYISILPVVVAATISTIVVRLSVLDSLKRPIDGGRRIADGQRLFGDNKTWLGLIGLVLFGALTMIVWGIICAATPALNESNWLYRTYENTIFYNLIIGGLMGFAYALAELPNSYLKRRQGIAPGSTVHGYRGLPNILLDHTDSIIGCAVVMLVVCPLSIGEFVAVIGVGAVTHLAVNVLLVIAGVKKNI